MSARRSSLFTTSALGALALAAVWGAPAHAQLVQGGTPAQSNGGAPTVNQAGGNTTVTLNGSRTVIDWDRFDINSGERADFIFANRRDIVLNRVNGAASTINGELNGMIGAGGPTGGNIWIYNANGMVIGANARINTGGLLVTTAAMDRATDSSAGGFLDGSSTQFGFTGASSDAGIAVRNGAQITSHGGSIALVSTSVTTETGSSISAQGGGNVLYGAAAKYKISFRPTGTDDLDLLSFEVASGADGTASTANGGDVLSLGGNTSGNRVFAALVSKTNVFSRLLSTGTVTATTAALDETGAIVLTTNHNIVNGAASAGAVANNGGADIATGGTITAPAVSMISSDSITTIMSSISAVGGTIDMLAEHGVIYGDGDYTAGTLTARAQGDISLWTGLKNIGSIGGLRSDSGSIIFTNRMSATIDGDIIAAGTADITIEGIAGGAGLIKAARAKLNGDGVFHLDSATTLDFIGASNDLTVTSNGDLNLNLSGTGNDMATVTLRALSGSIRQTDSGYGLAGTVVAQALGDIDLGASANNFSSVTVGSSNGGDVTLRSARGFSVAGSSSGAFNLVSDTGDITGNGVDMGRLTASAAGNIDFSGASNAIRALGDVNAGGNVLVSTNTGLAVDGTVRGGTLVTLRATGGDLTQGAGSLISGKTITVTASGSIVQDENAVIHGTGVTAASTTVQAGGDLILAGANRLADYGDVFLGWGSGSDVTLRSANRIYFDGGATPIGTLTLIADNGNIQQGSLAFTANTLIASATQGIDLGASANNSIAHLGNITSSTGEVHLRVGANNPLAIDGTISSASRVVFSARGAVSGTGTFSTPQLFLDLGGGGAINVAGSSNLLQLGVAGDTIIRASDSLTLSGMVVGNGRNVTLIADSGSITQTGGYFSGVLALTATAAGNIDLQSEYNGFTSFTGTSTGNGSIKLRGFGFDFATNTGGDVVVRTAGDVRALGQLRAGSLAVTSDTGSIILAPTGYAVGRFKDLSAVGDIDINAGDNILLTGAVTAGTVSLTSAMNIDQSAGSIVTANRVNLNSGGYIILDGANAVSSYAVSAAGIAALYSTRDVAIEAGMTVGDWLTVNSTGSITLGGGIVNGALTLEAGGNVGQTGSVTAASVTGRAGGDFLLDQIGNRLPVLGAVSSGGNLAVSTFSALDVSGDVTAVGQLTLRADLDLIQSAGTITGGVVNLRGLTVEQRGSGRVVAGELTAFGSRIDLDGANRVTGIGALTTSGGGEIIFRNEGDIIFDQSRFVTSGGRGPLTLVSDTGRITQASAMDTLRLTARAAQGIDLTHAQNNVDMITGLSSTSGDVGFTTIGSLNLNGDVTASGTVRLHSGGSIIQSLGSISAARLETSALWTTTLQSAGNNVAQLGNMETRGSGSIRYTGAGSFDLDGDINALDQSVELASADANAVIRQLSGTITAGQIALSGGSYTLTGTNQILSLGAIDARGLELNTTTDLDLLGLVRVAGDLKITADDVIQHTARIEIGSGGALSIDARSIDLGSATNRFGKLGSLSASNGNIALVSTGDVELAGAINAGTGAFSLAVPGSITQTGGGITAGSLSASAGIDLLLGGANDVGAITLLGATDDLTIRNRGSITLSALNLTGTLDVISDSGSIIAANAVVATELRSSAANGAIAFTDSVGNRISRIAGLTAGANATVQARNSGFMLTGDIDVGGTLTLRAGTGINQTGGRIKAVTLEANLYQTMTTGSVQLGGANDVDNVYVLAASGGGDVVYRDIDGFNVTYAVVGNRITLTSDAGAIIQSSGIMDGIQANELIVSAVDGISLNNEWNAVRTILGLTNTATGGINLVSRGGNMILGGNVAAAGQTVSLTTQNGSLSQSSGAITARRLDAAARTGITLTQAGNNIAQLGTLTNSLSGGIAYTDADGFGITGNISAAGQSLTLGSLDATADFYQATTGSVITAGTLNINGGRYYMLRGVNNTGNAIGAIGDVNAKLSLNTSGAVDFRGNVVTDFLELSSAGDITQSSGRIENHSGGQLAFWGTNISLTSATNQLGRILQLRTWDSDFTGWFNVGTGDVTLVSTGDLAVGYISAVNASLTSTGSIGTMSTGLAGLVNVERLSIDAGGTVSLGGAIRALANVTGRDEVFITSSADMALTGVINAGVGALALHSTGLLSQTGGSITAGSLSAQAGTGIDLGRTNFIGGLTGLATTSGDISYRNRSSIMLPDVSAPGRLTLVSETGSITQGAGTGVSAVTLIASAADAIDLTGTNHIANLGALSASNAISVTTQDRLTLTDDISAASVALTSSTGAIDQAGGIVTAATASLVAGGNVTLDRANAVGVYNAWAGIGGTLTLRNAGNLTVKGITAQSGTVNLTSNTGSVGQQIVPGYSIWAGKLNVNAATDIDLAAQNFTDLLGNLTAGGSIRYNSFQTLGLDGDIRAGGGVSFGISGYLGQYSGTIAASHLDVTASGIALIGANDIGSTTASRFSASDDITFRSVNSILLGAVSTPGLLSLTSDGGDIRQSAAFSAGRLDAIAAGDIVLDQLNALDTVNDITAGGVFSLRTAGALELDGRIAADDRVTFVTGGGLTQIGNTVIVTDLLEATAGTATTSGIRLLNHNRVGAVSFDAGGNDVRFRNTGDIAINAINAPTGTVELISNAGKITQQASGGLVVGSLVLNTANGVELYNADNQIARLDVVSRGRVSILTGQSGFGGILEVTRIDAAGQFVGLSNFANGITGGNITAGSLSVFGVLSIDLSTANDISGTVRLSSRDISFTNTGDLVLEGLLGYGGNAVLRSEEGAIRTTNGAIFSTDGLTAYGRNGIALAGQIFRIDGLSAGPDADISLSSEYALDIAGDISARNVELLSNGAPSVLSPTGGKITQSAGIITADRLIARALGDVTLDRSNRIATLGWTVSTTGNVSITNADALELTDAVTANGEVALDAASITQSGGLIQAANLRARASGALSLDAVNQIAATGMVALDAGADIAFRNDGGFVLGTVDTPGAATFTSLNGSIGQAAATRIGAGRLTVSAVNGGITLNAANLVDTLGGLTAGSDVIFRSAGDLALDGDIAAAGHEVTLRSNTGAISQASGAITALGLSIDANGAITLGGANGVTNLRNVTAGGDILYRNAGALMLWGDVTAAGHDVTLSTDSGSLLQMLFTSGIITANRLSASAGGALNLNHANRVNELGSYAAGSGLAGFTNDGSFALTGDVSGGEVALTALSGGIRQLSGTISTGSILANASESIQLGGANQVADAGPVRLNSSNGNVTFRALGDFTLDFGSAWGTFDVTSDNGSILQSGAITANLLNARAGRSITLTSDNVVANLGNLTAGAAGDIAFTAAGDLLLTDAIDAGGTVTLVANAGEITQSGGTITAASLNVSSDQGVLLDRANTVAAFAGTSANGNITLRNTGNISLGAITLPGTLTLTADTGAVTQTGDLTAGGLTVTARDGITLTRSGNAAGALVNLTNLDTGGIAYSDSGSIRIGSIDATGQAVILRASGDITQTTGIEAAVLNLTATGDVTLVQSAGNLINGLGTVDVRSLTLATAGDLDLAGAITASNALSLTVNGVLTQSGGLVTTPSLTLAAIYGIDMGSINQVDALTAISNGGTGGIRFVNGRALAVGNLSADGDLDLRVTAGQLTLNGTIFSRGNMQIDAAGSIGGAGVLDSRQSVRVTSGGSIDLRSVSGRDDIRIDADGDAKIAELLHLSGTADADGNGYRVDILGNNVTLGAGDRASITGADRFYDEVGATVRIGARAGSATLNLATMNHGVSLAATGDVRAYASDTLNLVNVSGTNVSLSAGTGGIGADRVDVAGDYMLDGPAFFGNVLQPLGVRAGTWTLTSRGDLDALGQTMEYGGDIAVLVDGTLSNGSVRSLAGAVGITANIVDLSQVSAATGIDATANAGDLALFSADTAAGNLNLTGGAVRVAGSLEAGADIGVLATTGDATIGYATAGRNITLAAQGNATLRQANLTGATGDLLITASGNATFGDDDATSGIGADRWFVRAAGATGRATVTGGGSVAINLDRSAKLDGISGRRVEVNVATGDLAIDYLIAATERGIVNVLGGSLVIGSGSAVGSALDLYADGDLTLQNAATGSSVYLTAGGLLDARTGSINGTNYVELTGGEIRAGAIDSGGDIDVSSTAGAITVDSVHSTGGNAIFNAYTDLNLGRVIANGGQLQAGGSAAVRAITATDGFALVALGNVTLGADTAALIATDNLLVTGGSLSGCACGSGGAALISLNGNVTVNLQSVTGVFDTIAAALGGDAGVHVVTGDLGISDLAGRNIAVTLPGGALTLMNAVSSGGDYTLTARDFDGNALRPVLSGGATRLNNVTITDTEGDLALGGMLDAAGDIRVSSVGNITGILSLLAGRDVEVTASTIRLGDVTGRDVLLTASAGGVDIGGALTIGRNYTLSGTGFTGNALAMSGTRLGDLLVTDTAGDFDYGTLDLGFAGSAVIRANGGAIRGGDISTLGNLSLSASGVAAGTLRSDQGGVAVESGAGVNLAGIRASEAIDVRAAGDLRLGNAVLSGTGINSFALAAGGDLVFGAADAASIGSGNVFTSAGSAMTGAGVQADGAITINLDRSAELTAIDGGTLELAVRNGDLAIGGIRTVGALFVTGPTGTLSIGDVATSAGHIGIAGQGNVMTGAVNGRFVVDIGSSGGSLGFRSIAGGNVTLTAAGGISANGANAGIFASTLALTAGGSVDLATHGTGSRIGNLGAITVVNGDFVLHNLQDLGVSGTIDISDGTLDLRVTGALNQNGGGIVARRLAGDISGFARLDGTNRIASLGGFSSAGLLLDNATSLGIDGVVDGGAGSVTIRARNGMTIGAAGAVRSTAAGDAITLASDGLFRNLAGGGALTAANGRWLVYTQAAGNPGASDPGNAFGGLAGRSYYGAAYDFTTGSFGTAPGAGNRFVYGYRPVLTVLPNGLTVTYDGQIPVLGIGITGLVNGDSAADAWSGAASQSGAGRNVGTYTITAGLGTLASEMNYDFAFGTSMLRIDPRAITATLAANGKTYDGTTGATGTLSLGGLVAGDDVRVSGTLSFDDRNAGAGKTVTANGIALTGADAGNYTVNLTATALADILARAITATLVANGKTYDGTSAATGALSLDGVLAGDDVGASGALAFADRNAGMGKTVTASGIALTGADAGNYVVNGSATALADILARAITATLTANGKTYDGTTGATGFLSLGGVLAGDSVSAAGSYAFADKNAGAGKTVTASGIALSGADAGNYVVNSSATALADILARTITATLAANGRIYDGTTNATGTLSLENLVAGDEVTVSGALTFADRNVGAGKTVTASGITLGGADAGNYVVNGTATGLADILARAITATLIANGKIYDGTTAATGALSLGNVIAGDDVTASGALSFADRNAGTGKTVTANGIALGGADAGNYVVNTTAAALADIVARAISATLNANGKVYDGTTAATGTLSLAGVLAGDEVNATGSYSFADKNAGAGRTVTASGIGLSGADAGNYVVNTSATALADILARTITATLAANGRIYDGTIAATGALSLGGVVAGDQVGATGSYSFADKNAGTGKTVTASGITLNGADAGNYVVNTSATGLADILARTITATLAANGKTYDGTTAATGTLSLGGVIAGDQVGVNGSITFDSRNAGERIATASGLTLNGTDAGNYIVTGTATDTATIARLAITGTATVDSRVYDGTTNATGRIALNGVLAGDTVSATAGYAFANANAGTGRTVSVNGLTLSGADAGNYAVTLGANPVLADILVRQVTVAADDLTKMFGQRDPAFTWRIVNGSLVGGDVFTGALGRAPGEQAGTYLIGRGGLALSSNYALTVVPGSLVIRFVQSMADGSDALHRRRPSDAFSLYDDPSANLTGDAGEQ